MGDKLAGCYFEAKESKEEVTTPLIRQHFFFSDLLNFLVKAEIDIFNVEFNTLINLHLCRRLVD